MRSSRTLIAAIGLLMAGCTKTVSEPAVPDPPVATTLTASPEAITMTSIGETQPVSVTVRDQNGATMSGVALSWSTGDGSIASVVSNGQTGAEITAIDNGQVTVSVFTGGLMEEITVLVAQEVAAVQITVPSDTLLAGGAIDLGVTATDALGTEVAGAAFDWESLDSSVALVNDGNVTGVSLGLAGIVATSGGVADTATLGVAEEFFYNTRSSSATSGAVLGAGTTYHVEVIGNWSVWTASTWWGGTCFGSADAMPIYPSPGVTNGTVGADPGWSYSEPSSSSNCSVGARRSNFEFRRSSAEGWLRDDALDPAFNTDHRYVWEYEGQGEELSARIADSARSDNYGQLRVRVFQQGP